MTILASALVGSENNCQSIDRLRQLVTQKHSPERPEKKPYIYILQLDSLDSSGMARYLHYKGGRC
jgi:hypothetical protein